MVELNSQQSALFSKYWGRNDLVEDEEFWSDVYAYYQQEAIAGSAPLPLLFSPYTVRMVGEWLDCPPGKCGKCCHYDAVQLNRNDIARIIENTEYTEDSLGGIVSTDGDVPVLLAGSGCPFLKDNRCTIHKFRPDACYMFPFDGRDAVMDGKLAKQMRIRLICEPALAVARRVITQMMSDGDKILLPDLTVIPKAEQGSNK